MSESPSTARRWGLLVTIAGAVSATLGLLVLVGWYTHTVILIQILPAFAPMQYNTALGFLLCGSGLVALVHGRTRLAVALGSVAGAVGILTLIEYVFGVQLGIDQLLLEHYITTQTSHPGRMAPNTALCFSLTGAALIAVARWKEPGQRFRIAGVLGVVVLSLSFIAFFGYTTGARTAYGWGQMTRMAVHTSAGFVALAVGLLTVAFREGVVWAAISSALVPDKPVRERRKIVATSIGIMALFSMAVGLTVIRELYSTGLDVQRDRLVELVRSRTRMIEAVARFDEQYSREMPGGPRAATLSQVVEAHERSPGFGRTGEFTLARREGDEIVFIVRPPHAGPDFVERVAIASARAEPMRGALDGESGTLIGVDYRGERVVAAYGPVAPLDLGLVAKMDLAEVRAPFVRSAFLTLAIALMIVVIGASATMVSINPLVRRVETQATDLRLANVELTREAAEREESVRALGESEEKFRSLAENTPNIVFTINRDGKILYMNHAPEGVDLDQVIGTNIYTHMDSAFHESVREHVRTVFDGGKPGQYETKGIGPGGRQSDYLSNIGPVLDDHGEVISAIISTQDITELKRADEALRNERNRAQMYLDIAGSILVALDADGRITMINQKGYRTLGYDSEQELLGKDWFTSCIPTQDAKEIRSMFDSLMRGNGEPVTRYENNVLAKAGELRLIAWNNQLIREGEGTITGILSSGDDITERKRAEDEIRALNVSLERRVAERTAELKAANKELEAFSYSVSHDLKAPLRAIDGYSGKLEEELGERLNPEGRRLLGVVRQRAQHMGRLIDDLLTFSRLGRAELKITYVDMHKLAQTTFAELAGMHAEREIEFTAGDLPTARADFDLIRQVWVNLLDNAIKFTGQREVARIEVGYREEADRHVFFVRDNGAGFDMEYVDKLFGVFQRLHYEDEFPGTGVGLANVRRIVERHGGDAWAEGEVDRGATIFFGLPRSERTT